MPLWDTMTENHVMAEWRIAVMDRSRKRELARFLVSYLVEEAREYDSWLPDDIVGVTEDEDASFDDLWLAFRALVNVRPPWPASPEFLTKQDLLLSALIGEAGIHTIADATSSADDERIRLWRGDITTLATDAIVNAANSGMTGCWQPLHYCVDNAIHTFAGVQLRAEMAETMEAQGREEPTASFQVSAAYNLPSKHIIHIVGPIAEGRPTDEHRAQLALCYEACLDGALAGRCISIAFCCISTGVFGFPQDEAARIAVGAVRRWFEENPDASIVVVFDVFGETDETLYKDLLGIA